jgi:DNA processing protein
MKINTISSMADAYPSRLVNIPDKPDTIYSKGDIPEYRLGIAIVGTRKPTSYGKQVTAMLTERLAERGAVIISGLAHGIDTIAHQSTLRVGGKTIAVMACGLDQIYPAANRKLAEAILQAEGAIIGEYHPGTPPLQHRFLERNRLVSGLSDIVIVTEASLRSGTMNTVAHALEQGRDVFAVPGPITSAMSAGCNALIAQGAQPIVNIEQFVERLLPRSAAQTQLFGETSAEQVILDLLAAGHSDGESIHSLSGLDAAQYTQALTMLELRGAIRALGANKWGI